MTVLANAGGIPISKGRDRISVAGIAPSQVAQLLVESRVRLEELVSGRVDARGGILLAHPRCRGAHGREADRRMIRTLHSEWTKLRTQRGTLVGLFMTGVLMVGFSAFFASEQETDAVFGGDDDLVQMGLMGIAFAEIAAVVVGASLITAEFASGMIRTTLTATQGRFRVLLAKAIVLSVVVFPIALGRRRWAS